MGYVVRRRASRGVGRRGAMLRVEGAGLVAGWVDGGGVCLDVLVPLRRVGAEDDIGRGGFGREGVSYGAEERSVMCLHAIAGSC